MPGLLQSEYPDRKATLMSTIDIVDSVAAGSVATLEVYTKHNVDDGYETTEERLFALLVNLVDRYSKSTGPGDYVFSVELTLQAIHENLVMSPDQGPVCNNCGKLKPPMITGTGRFCDDACESEYHGH